MFIFRKYCSINIRTKIGANFPSTHKTDFFPVLRFQRSRAVLGSMPQYTWKIDNVQI